MTTYTGAIELGEAGDVVVEDVTIDDLDTEAWTAPLPEGSVVAGTVITGEMQVRLVDGDRANQAATGQLDVSESGDRVLRGRTRFA
jgi:hypothetical protein